MVAAGSAEYDPKPAKGKPATAAWVYWKRPEEWAAVIYEWVRFLPLSLLFFVELDWRYSFFPILCGSFVQIKSTGQTNSILTFYELTEGGDLVHTTGSSCCPFPPSLLDRNISLGSSHSPSLRTNYSVNWPFFSPLPPSFLASKKPWAEFYQIPHPLLRKALDVLIKQGKAQVLKGIGEEGDGVKFV
jgi:ESCRT-II complex subunit VPS25